MMNNLNMHARQLGVPPMQSGITPDRDAIIQAAAAQAGGMQPQQLKGGGLNKMLSTLGLPQVPGAAPPPSMPQSIPGATQMPVLPVSGDRNDVAAPPQVQEAQLQPLKEGGGAFSKLKQLFSVLAGA